MEIVISSKRTFTIKSKMWPQSRMLACNTCMHQHVVTEVVISKNEGRVTVQHLKVISRLLSITIRVRAEFYCGV